MRNSANKGMKINFNPDPTQSMEDKIKKVSIRGGTKTNRSPEVKNEKLESNLDVIFDDIVKNLREEEE